MNLLLSHRLLLALFAGGAVCALLSGFRVRPQWLWAVLTALCGVAELLAGLVLGGTLEELLLPLLALTALSLLPLARGEGRDEL
ncbi:MAG: hypothetical protein LUC87_11275 [Clostridiales bacterium]|nr:hypothetical protein [Clostridiales bacterium]MCD8367063.1 hypothetical protein [Clostridiales bacterium]